MSDYMNLIDRDSLSNDINTIPLSEAVDSMKLYRAVLRRLCSARTICLTEKWLKYPEETPNDGDVYIVTVEFPDRTTEHESTKRRIEICEYNLTRNAWYDVVNHSFFNSDEKVVAFRRFPSPYKE